MNSSFRLPCLVAAALLVAACAPQTETVKLFEDDSDAKRQYTQLLVIGIAGDSDTRIGLEDSLVAKLTASGADAVAGHTLTSAATTLQRAEIDAAAERSGSDGILITHIVSIETTAETREGRSEVVAECRGGDPGDYFLYDYEELKEPDSVKIAHTVVAVTNLYDVASNKRVWSIQSTCFEKASMGEVLMEEANAITRQLQLDKLIG